MSYADAIQEPAVQTVNIDMYETGGEEGSGFHVFNMGPNQYHRRDVLQRTGAVDMTCTLEKVIHGAMAKNSDRYATLLVVRWRFQPKGTRRISQATIGLAFSGTYVQVEKISFEDTYSYMPTTQDETVTRGGEATAGGDQFASLSATGKWEKVVSKTTSHAITLTGGKRLINNRQPHRIATWTLSENPSQKAGIPASLRVAVLVSSLNKAVFDCHVSCECKTDLLTAAEGMFKRIPKDDPIKFQPDPRDRGTHPNMNVSYGDDELGDIDLDDLGDATFRAILKDGDK